MKTITFLALVQMLFCAFGQAQQTETPSKNLSKNELRSLVALGVLGAPLNDQYKLVSVHVGNPGIYYALITGKTPAGRAVFGIQLEEAPIVDPNKPGPSSVELNGLQYAGMRKIWDFGISYDGALKNATESGLISALDKKGNETRIQVGEGQSRDISSSEVLAKWMQAKTFWLGQAKTTKSREALAETVSKWLKTPDGEALIKSFIDSKAWSDSSKKSYKKVEHLN